MRKNGLIFADTGYFICCNGDRSQDNFWGPIRFLVKAIPYTGDDSWIEAALMDAERCLKGDSPELTSGFKRCSYLLDIERLAIEQGSESAGKNVGNEKRSISDK